MRIAASQRADPYSLVQTGLGALGGALHGAAALSAEELLREVERGAEPSQVIGLRLRRGERIAGFGHALHASGDPRASALLAAAVGGVRSRSSLAAAVSVQDVMQARGLPAPEHRLRAGSAGARRARCSPAPVRRSWRSRAWRASIAHALEEYARPSEFPWHTLYVGIRADVGER